MYLKGRLRKTNFNIHKIPTMPRIFSIGSPSSSRYFICLCGILAKSGSCILPGFAAIEIDGLQIRSLSKRYEQARILLQIIHLVSDVCYLRIHKVI